MNNLNSLIEITDRLDALLSIIGAYSQDSEEKHCINIAWDLNYDLRMKLFDFQKKYPTTDPYPDEDLPTTGYTPYNIGNRIQIARENLGLSEADLARQLGTYSDHISDWECGITEPPASMVIPLANALKCDPMWLLTGEAANSQGLSGKQQQPASQRVDALSREVPQR
ncbi:helix-turn-helix domain-containing protein [Salmonella enterica]|nr:helix-turn-helix domain-containing protein [Salmonella enterica]ELM5565003.1 helix-turn-helix domain-containing protein [Salmonella enterica]